MIAVEIPGFGTLRLGHLVADFNGTLACDGVLLDEVRDRLTTLSADLSIHVLTADTFGRVRAELRDLSCQIEVLPRENQDKGKRSYIRQLGLESVVAVGNGRNDRLMLKEAALGMVVVQQEGAASVTLAEADVVCRDIGSALDLLTHPLRLVATLRS